jgi:hypothetical protein
LNKSRGRAGHWPETASARNGLSNLFGMPNVKFRLLNIIGLGVIQQFLGIYHQNAPLLITKSNQVICKFHFTRAIMAETQGHLHVM